MCVNDRNLEEFLKSQRESLVVGAVAKATGICEEVWIAIERIIRRRKRMTDYEARDTGVTLEQELFDYGCICSIMWTEFLRAEVN